MSQGYKTIFILNSTEHEIDPSHTFTNRIDTISESLKQKTKQKQYIFFSIIVLYGYLKFHGQNYFL